MTPRDEVRPGLVRPVGSSTSVGPEVVDAIVSVVSGNPCGLDVDSEGVELLDEGLEGGFWWERIGDHRLA